jgi:hypothetical protein
LGVCFFFVAFQFLIADYQLKLTRCYSHNFSFYVSYPPSLHSYFSSAIRRWALSVGRLLSNSLARQLPRAKSSILFFSLAHDQRRKLSCMSFSDQMLNSLLANGESWEWSQREAVRHRWGDPKG